MSKKDLSTTHRFQNSAEQLLSHVFIQTGQCHMIINVKVLYVSLFK